MTEFINLTAYLAIFVPVFFSIVLLLSRWNNTEKDAAESRPVFKSEETELL